MGKVVAVLATANTATLDGSIPFANGSQFSIPVIKLSPEVAKSAHAVVKSIGPTLSNTQGEYLAPSTKGKWVTVDVLTAIPVMPKPLPEGEGTFGVRAISTESYDIGAPGDTGAPLLQDGALRAVVNSEDGAYSLFEIRKSLGQVPDAHGLKVSSLRK
ncbi:hypothetical protein [Tsukamurella pseudospumae]|uniref:Uncharacterized protein n=1 Tax=Tsukamurella pseudospumae TaxID=239498 RepID=A0A138AMK5_9ACTN|nr:hypothetical protein [Tsukamurella pseudospumae]KXP11619.1 hypothetical protein AXK60_24725 [Tsukamurella pseudospumae]